MAPSNLPKTNSAASASPRLARLENGPSATASPKGPVLPPSTDANTLPPVVKIESNTEQTIITEQHEPEAQSSEGIKVSAAGTVRQYCDASTQTEASMEKSGGLVRVEGEETKAVGQVESGGGDSGRVWTKVEASQPVEQHTTPTSADEATRQPGPVAGGADPLPDPVRQGQAQPATEHAPDVEEVQNTPPRGRSGDDLSQGRPPPPYTPGEEHVLSHRDGINPYLMAVLGASQSREDRHSPEHTPIIPPLPPFTRSAEENARCMRRPQDALWNGHPPLNAGPPAPSFDSFSRMRSRFNLGADTGIPPTWPASRDPLGHLGLAGMRGWNERRKSLGNPYSAAIPFDLGSDGLRSGLNNPYRGAEVVPPEGEDNRGRTAAEEILELGEGWSLVERFLVYLSSHYEGEPRDDRRSSASR